MKHPSLFFAALLLAVSGCTSARLSFSSIDLIARESVTRSGSERRLHIAASGEYVVSTPTGAGALAIPSYTHGSLRNIALRALDKALTSARFSTLRTYLYGIYWSAQSTEYEITATLTSGQRRVVLVGNEDALDDEVVRFRELWRSVSSLVPGAVPSP